MKEFNSEFAGDLQAKWFEGMEKFTSRGAENVQTALGLQMEMFRLCSEAGLSQMQAVTDAKDSQDIVEAAKAQVGEWQAFGERATASFSDLVKENIAFGQEWQANWQSLAEKSFSK